MLKTKPIFFIAILLACVFIFSACTQKEQKESPKYEVGFCLNKTVYETFTFVGEEKNVVISGYRSKELIRYRQTESGGWVAWTSEKYVYTNDNVGEREIINAATYYLIDMESFDFYKFD